MVFRIAVLAIACVACGRLGFEPLPSGGDLDADLVAPPPPSDSWLGGFTYRKSILVRPGATGTLTDFPVGIIAAADADLAAHARTDGADLVVTAADGISQLDSELVRFDAATGAVELWTRAPSLVPTPTRLYLYYGGGVSVTSSPSVWSSLFAGVWHMSNGNGALDSTSHANHLQATSAPAEPAHVNGVAGEARATDGIDDRLDVPDPPDGSLDFGVSSFTYSMWVTELAAQNQFDMAFYKGGASVIHPGYCMMLGTADWEAKVHDGTMFDNVFFGQQPDLTNGWVHLVAVVDRSRSMLVAYTNGVFVQEKPLMVGSLSSAEPFDVGFGPVGAQPFRGRIDEVRIYTRALDADWIAVEYANLTSASFLDFEVEEVLQ